MVLGLFSGEVTVSDLALATIALTVVVAGLVAWVKSRLFMQRFGGNCLEVLRKFFAPNPLDRLTTVSRVFPLRMRVDLQKSLSAALAGTTVHRHCGISRDFSHEALTLTSLWTPSHHSVNFSNLEHEDEDVGEAEPVRCMNNALWLLEKDGVRYAVLLSQHGHFHQISGMRVEIGYSPGTQAERIATDLFKALERGVAEAGTYRGKVLSLESSDNYRGESNALKVHHLRPVNRDGLILSKETLDLLDRNIVAFAEKRRALAEHGLSAKKGLLFYGPPGTGKTLTIHYLIHALKGHTFLLATAEQQGAIAEYVQLARLLQPSVVVIEDADLIARDRQQSRNVCVESLQSTLLNEMDGLRPDAEIFFILTTNRPETLEPALVARPGRIDQAIEFPLPDEECRARLVKLYAGTISIGETLVKEIAAKTEGVSAAFMKEFVRRAMQYALDAQRSGIEAPDVERALQDMLFHSKDLQLRLLGAKHEDAE